MKKLIIFALFSGFLLSATLTKYSTYNRDNYFDVLLNFNEPYSPQVKILRGKNIQAVSLGGLISNEKRELKVSSPLISSLLIYPFENNGQTSTVLEFKTNQEIKITAAITSNDGFALRVRAQAANLGATPQNRSEPSSANNNSADNSSAKSIEFASESELTSAWVKMIIALVCIIAILLLLKSWLNRKKSSAPVSQYAKAAAKTIGAAPTAARVLCEKPLDEHNRFIVLEYEGSRYKLIIGQGNIWLNQPAAPTPASENFEQYFLENQQRLSNLIKQKNLDEYKEKITHRKDLL